jgi:hypothetical protein
MAYTTIDKPSDYFNTVLYTGNASSSHAITGVGFKPDWVWIKNRDTTGNHGVWDIVRGATEQLYPNQNYGESTAANSLKSFDTDGFTVGSDGDQNGSGNGLVSWNWLADNTTGSSNTDGSITSTVSANTTAGFSIVSYTGNETSGATIGHGLGVVPTWIIVKRRNSGNNWGVYHQGIGNGNALYLDTTSAKVDSNAFWNDTTPTSTVFTLGDSATVNGSSDTYIAYCFTDIKGYSKFGSYTGNGNTDGTFIYLGFRPAMVITKKTNGTTHWTLNDSKRLGYNPAVRLYPNLTNAEESTGEVDLLSNGFKCYTTNDNQNGSGDSYIYMAFAESPFVNSNNGVPTNAR